MANLRPDPIPPIYVAGHRGLVGSAIVWQCNAARRDSLVKMAGFKAYDYNE
jgi:hypothetical protein